MPNPRSHADPDWYERPGETVALDTAHRRINGHGYTLEPEERGPRVYGPEVAIVARRPRIATGACTVCGHAISQLGYTTLCAYCERAQQRDETQRARDGVALGYRFPLLSMREPWER